MQNTTYRNFTSMLTAAMLGFFPLVAQTLLFRDFLSVYEGSELGIGVFFSSWLLWVALGAMAARKTPPLPHVDLLFLLYIPAYILQHFLFRNSRELAGIRSWELFPLFKMLPVSFLVNSAVSFVTGMLFPLSCRWFEQQKRALPVSRVYIAEALGSFAGGVAVTALLMAGVWSEFIFLVSALMLTTAVFLSCRKKIVLAGVAVLLAALAFSGFWNRFENHKAWERLLPSEQYQGTFTTAQARYLYGLQGDQFNVISFESVSETIPQTEYVSQLAALHLAQKPDASRILVLGTDAYSLCRRLAQLPSITHITWLHPDLRYPDRLIEVLPSDMKTGLDKIEMPAMDARRFLQDSRSFDLVILKQPDIATLAGNRYYTEEFFHLIRGALAPGGVVGVRVPGGENFMGGELVRIGASVFQTLRGVFADMAVKPGDETWLLASGADNVLTQSADQLVARFAAIDGAADIFPPSGLRSLYPIDRVEFQLQAYNKIKNEKLINRDRHPQALFHALLLAARQGGAGEKSVQAVVKFSRHGFVLFLSLFLIYGFLRAIYLGRPRRNKPAVFDSVFLVASTGFVGLALNVVLMFLFQSRFGSIFLYIGLISAFFMLGLFCGALLARRKNILHLILPVHVLSTAAIILLPDALPMAAYFAALFLFGLFSGVYFPAAALLLPPTALRTASTVEMYDHFGGAIGGVLIGMLFLPVFGITQTLFLVAVLLAVNIYPVLFAPAIRAALSGARQTDRLRVAGYLLFGMAALLLIGYHASSSRDATELGYEEATEMLKKQAGGKNIRIFDSREHAPDVFGYGGPLWMAVAVDNGNRLVDYKIYRHRETPDYLRMTEQWMKQFIGDDLSSHHLQSIDALSGATLTCNAFKQTLVSGAASFEGKSSAQPRSIPIADYGSLLFFALLCASALFLRKRAVRMERRLFLFLVLLLAGVHLNMQYSTDHLLRLLALELPPLHSLVPLVLTVAVPLLVVLFGNIYCGWLCPFGALQELAGCGIRHTPDKKIWHYARFVKYILLFALVIFFGCGGGGAIFTADPLVSFFSSSRSTVILCFGTAAVLLSVFFGRFWCRNLCPAGAFLALLNRIRLLRQWIPNVPFARCDYGVIHRDELDCICCDRCRYQQSKSTQDNNRESSKSGKNLSARCSFREIILLISVIAAAVLWLSQLRYTREKRGILTYASRVLPTTGKVRNADMELIHRKIRRGQLSDREALYYDGL
ncbi:MAG: 4Fe-4S binding protein [Kiritimatiellia bacterium]